MLPFFYINRLGEYGADLAIGQCLSVHHKPFTNTPYLYVVPLIQISGL